MRRLFNSLRFQVSAAFVALLLLFAGACLVTLSAFQRQLDADAVVEIAARLELASNQMHMQAMNYDAHAPRDYPTYYRDVNLYYRDLTAQIELFDAIVMGFMSGDFSAVLDRPAAWMKPARNPRLVDAVTALEVAWAEHREGLVEALGDDTDEPRLEWAAEYSIEHIDPLERATGALADRLRDWAEVEHARLRLFALTLLGGAAVVALALLALLHFYALRPVQQTLDAVRRSTEGEFGEQVTVAGATEIRDLSSGFNTLSARLHLLFQLLGRLQRGNDVDEVVEFLGRDFRGLLRFDWIGVVLVTPDNATVRLEASSLDGEPESGGKPLFRLSGTLLEQALAQGKPLHIRDMTAQAKANPRYEFLRDIARRGLADAVFLPVAVDSSAPAVVAFATREPGRYDEPHMRFLTNIAQLISASFARTVRFAERGRLAAIGEFASGIAHELRTPLATLSLALDHFERQPLPDGSRRRLTLARTESARMGRLLDDMLLYAKPLRLASALVDLTALARETCAQVADESICSGGVLVCRSTLDRGLVIGDEDRLRQILLNLLGNACEAAPPGGRIDVALHADRDRWIRIDITNPGEPIPAELGRRIFEPFVSTKPAGTGLGLAIVERLAHLHGAEVSLFSEDALVIARLRFPLAPEGLADLDNERPGKPVSENPAPTILD